ncbi:MAG: DUF2130 domain-containing protein [Candidatus Pacearchaeota archaeon]
MENKNFIICPKCGTEINVNEVLFSQLEEQIRKEYEERTLKKEKELQLKLQKLQDEKSDLEKKKEEFKELVIKEVNEKLKIEKAKVEKTLRQKIEDEISEQVKELKKELAMKSEQVKELNRVMAENERLKREQEELREKIMLEMEKNFSEKLKDEKIKIQRQLEESNMLRFKEKEKIIEDLKAQLEEAKRKAEQGSVQLKGDIQEIEIQNILKSLYPTDEILEIKKGQRGADLLQIIRTNQGVECGKIYYESKRTKNFDYSWLQKLRDDNLDVKADILVLVTETMPEGETRFFFKDGVWICSFLEVKAFSLVLRHWLINVHSIFITQQGRGTKKEMLYNYLTSQEFKGTFGAIVEGFVSLQKSYQEEKLKMQKIWKEREKQLEKILTNAISFYGSIKGIVGASIPEIKMLESGQETLTIDQIKDIDRNSHNDE